jgi:hypothetical protein
MSQYGSDKLFSPPPASPASPAQEQPASTDKFLN